LQKLKTPRSGYIMWPYLISTYGMAVGEYTYPARDLASFYR